MTVDNRYLLTVFRVVRPRIIFALNRNPSFSPKPSPRRRRKLQNVGSFHIQTAHFSNDHYVVFGGVSNHSFNIKAMVLALAPWSCETSGTLMLLSLSPIMPERMS